MKLLKGFFLAALMIGAMFTTEAQNSTPVTTVAGDTVITSGSLDTVFKTISSTAGYSSLAIQIKATKASGTVALKAYLYGSLDGTNYVVSDSTAAFVDQTTNIIQLTKVAPPFTSYKLQVRPSTSGATTQNVALKFWYVQKKYDH